MNPVSCWTTTDTSAAAGGSIVGTHIQQHDCVLSGTRAATCAQQHAHQVSFDHAVHLALACRRLHSMQTVHAAVEFRW